MFWNKKPKPDLDASMAAVVRSAEEIAGAFVAMMPTDRPVSAEELRVVEDMAIAEIKKSAEVQFEKVSGSNVAKEMVFSVIESRVRAAFRKRFYSDVPLFNDNEIAGHA